jgi:hypothetical protein
VIVVPEARGTVELSGTIPTPPPVEAAAGVEAQNAPTPAWKPQNGFHKLPQGPLFL